MTGCRRPGRDRRDLTRIDAPQLAVHSQERRQEVAGGRRHLQLGRMLDDLGHNPAEKLVVDFNPAVPEPLLEHVVDERDLRLVAGIVAREGGNRGAAAEISIVSRCPRTRSGFSIVMVGGALRPAET